MHAKFRMMHTFTLEDLIEMIKEEMNELKLLIIAQAVSRHSTSVTG